LQTPIRTGAAVQEKIHGQVAQSVTRRRGKRGSPYFPRPCFFVSSKVDPDIGFASSSTSQNAGQSPYFLQLVFLVWPARWLWGQASAGAIRGMRMSLSVSKREGKRKTVKDTVTDMGPVPVENMQEDRHASGTGLPAGVSDKNV